MSLTNSKQHNKYTILQVVPALVSGGIERGTIEIAKQLKESGYIPIVVSAGGSLVEQLVDSDILHISMNTLSKNPYVILRNTKKISRLIQKYNVDLIHARSRAPAWSCYIAAKATNKKFITTFHGVYNISNIFKKYYNSVMLKGDKIIAVSNFIKQHILDNYKVVEEKIVVIQRGVDYNHFNINNVTEAKSLKCREKYNIPKNVPILLLPSRMTNWKGHISLVDALGKLTHRDFYCLMVGDLSKHPSFAQRVKERINALKLQSKVWIFGNESDMLTLYGNSDIILSASIEPEAFGRTIIEGQSMEKLVIATNIGGATETIIDKETGYHVKPNDPDDLAATIDYCISILGTDEAKRVQTAARKSMIENFSLNSTLRKTVNLYKSLLQ